MDEEEYKKELIIKLKEESEEYFAAQSPKESLEELADMLEVIRALAVVHGATWEELDVEREEGGSSGRFPGTGVSNRCRRQF